MKKIKLLSTVSGLYMIVCLSACRQAPKEMGPEEYAAHIAGWDSTRLQRLKAPDGWLNLAGLFWLQPGENSVGSDPDNDIVFPRGPARIGVMTLAGDQVSFYPFGDVNLMADGKDISGSIRIFGNGRDAELLTTDSLGFFIIRRGERTGIRLRDYIHPRIDALQQIDRYSPDQEWIIKAGFIEPDEPLTVRVPDVLGDVSEERVPGILEFELEGQTLRLFPTGSRQRLFVIFADDTNALETYGAGRFLYADGPDSEGNVYLDFNKAYNPPCAFSPYATCPLPPRENFLPFKVLAGEKAVHY